MSITEKRKRNTTHWTEEQRKKRTERALAARGICPIGSNKSVTELLTFLLIVGYSSQKIAERWIANGPSILRRTLREGLVFYQPNLIRSTRRINRHGASISPIKLLLLSKTGHERAKMAVGIVDVPGENSAINRVLAPSNRYVRHDLLTQIRALEIKAQLDTQAREFLLFSKRNQFASNLLRPGTLNQFIPDLWFEVISNIDGNWVGVFLEIERSTKSPDEIVKFGSKLSVLRQKGQVHVMFESEQIKTAFINFGLGKDRDQSQKHWALYGFLAESDLRNVHFEVFDEKEVNLLPG